MSHLTLFLLRHGQTPFSRDDVYCGAGLDPGLTAEGLEMAQRFAESYRARPWAGVYCSPLRRTRQTAAPLCEALGITPEVREGFKEIAYGRWEGLSREQIEREFHDDHLRWSADPGWCPPTGGETAVTIAARAMGAVEEIKARHGAAGGNVLVISHKATIRILLCTFLGVDVGRFRYRLGCPVGSVSVVEFGEHGPLVQAVADRTHLSAELRALAGT